MPLSSSRIRGHWTKLEPGSTLRGSGNTASVAKDLTRNADVASLSPLHQKLASLKCNAPGVKSLLPKQAQKGSVIA